MKFHFSIFEAKDMWGRTPLHWAVVNGHRRELGSWMSLSQDVSAEYSHCL